MIKLVVMDMAGTTVKDNNFVHKCFVNAFRDNGYDINEEDVNELMGYPKPVAIRMVTEAKGLDISEEMRDKIHEDFVKGTVDFYLDDPKVSEIAGTSEVFKTLKEKGIKVAIDTGFSRPTMNAIIQRLGWAELIDYSIASNEVENGRPYPDMIFKSMEALGLKDITEVAKIGDTKSDMMQGDAAGCKLTIGVTTGAFTKEMLEKHPHTHIVDSLSEAMDIIIAN